MIWENVQNCKWSKELVSCFYKPVSQSCMHSSEKWNILMGHWTITLGRQNGRLVHWPRCSCVGTNTKHWKLLLQQAVHIVRQVWLCCGLPEFLTFRYCTWLSNWLIDNDQEPIRKTVTCCCSSTLKPKINDSVEGSWCQHFLMVKSEYFYLHRGISPVNCKSVSVYTVRHPWIRCSMIYLTLSCSIISLTRHLYHRSSSG